MVDKSDKDILFCEMQSRLGNARKKMSYKNFEILGISSTRAGAALDFIDNFHKQFPTKKGIYELVLRSPFTYDKDHDEAKMEIRHVYRLKGSYTTLKKFDKETNVVKIIE